MKRLGIFLLITTFICFAGPGNTTLFSPPLDNGIEGLHFTVYNSTDNQYLLTWLSEISSINAAIYDSSGTLVGSQVALTGADSSGSSPSCSYNSINNQYLITWQLEEPVFSILNSSGTIIIGPNSVSISPSLIVGDDTVCCYNSVNNQYCITWTAQNVDTSLSASYFAIINADGTTAQGETAIPPIDGQTTSNYTDSFVAYNATNNQYLFTWLSVTESSSNTAFAIYNADGTIAVQSTVIPQASSLNTISYPIFTCYNNTANQYFICWQASDSMGYFAIYDYAGNEVVPATQIATPTYFNQVPVCSYDINNNQYFVSWQDGNAQALCTIFDANGDVVSADIVFPLLPDGAPAALVFNSCNTNADQFFVTWYASNNIDAYFNLFTLAPNPPTQLTGQRILNRFANYGKYVTRLAWVASASSNVASYQIYNDNLDLQIGAVPASITFYQAHNQPRASTTYSVRAVDNYGDLSSPVSITL